MASPAVSERWASRRSRSSSASRPKSGQRRCPVISSSAASTRIGLLARRWMTCGMKWVSGGIASSGCASSISRSSVVPDRATPTMKIAGAGPAGRRVRVRAPSPDRRMGILCQLRPESRARLRTLSRRKKATDKARKRELPRWARPLEVPDCPPGLVHRPARLRRGRGPALGHVVVVPGHGGAPAGRDRRGPGQGAPLLQPLLAGRAPGGLRRDLRQPLPASRGALAGEWTPSYMLDFWTPRLLREAAPRREAPGPAARPGRALPLGRGARRAPRPGRRAHRPRAVSPTRFIAASTARSCAGCSITSRASRSCPPVRALPRRAAGRAHAHLRVPRPRASGRGPGARCSSARARARSPSCPSAGGASSPTRLADDVLDLAGLVPRRHRPRSLAELRRALSAAASPSRARSPARPGARRRSARTRRRPPRSSRGASGRSGPSAGASEASAWLATRAAAGWVRPPSFSRSRAFSASRSSARSW